jgi:hypothetical protein
MQVTTMASEIKLNITLLFSYLESVGNKAFMSFKLVRDYLQTCPLGSSTADQACTFPIRDI